MGFWGPRMVVGFFPVDKNNAFFVFLRKMSTTKLGGIFPGGSGEGGDIIQVTLGFGRPLIKGIDRRLGNSRMRGMKKMLSGCRLYQMSR